MALEISTSPFNLKGKIAAVTGASRGIGQALALGLSAQGATVVLIGRSRGPLEETAASIEETGGKAFILQADVAVEHDVSSAADALRDSFGTLDILVNNAGVSPLYATIDKVSIDDWNHVIGVNLTGVFLCCRHFGILMGGERMGAIINISSIAGAVGLKKQVPYSASKGGVEQLTKALALDWAERNVRVNAVAYGFMETDLTQGMRDHPHLSARLLDRTPMNRFGTMDDVAGAAVFLASDSASYITGHTLMVDGGYTAG